MATEVITRVIDDIDRLPVEDGKWERITFTYKAVEYVIDLREANAEEFHKLLAFYANHAVPKKKVGRPKKHTAPKKPVVANDGVVVSGANGKKPQRPGIRKWAIEHGYAVNPNGGRIPQDAVDAYDTAHSG